jgi:hypothetical protein
VFQSSDWGQHWVETLAPPGFGSGPKSNLAPRCSQVGCVLGPWLRVGWEAEVPGARVRTQNVAPAPPRMAREALPTLSCEQLAAETVSEQTSDESAPRLALGTSPLSLVREQDYEGSFSWATVHPQNGTGSPLGLRASFAIRAHSAADPVPLPANWAGYSSLARISFVSAFEPNGRIQAASIRWRTLTDAAHAAGVELPSFEVEQVDGLSALPVLGLNPGEAEGLLLDSDIPIWVRGSGATEALAPVGIAEESKWVSAVQSAANRLTLLSGDQDGSLEVFEFSAGRARRLFRVPGLEVELHPNNPDALAIGPNGKLAILRAPSGGEPSTSADPALLLHEDGGITELAPWSRLFLADAPECKPQASDYRAVLQTSRAWLHLVDAHVPVTDEALQAGMFAILRGNAERLCLEAVELAGAPAERLNSSNETRLSARFVGRGRGAARLGFAPGFQFRQALRCHLSGAR